MNITTGRDGKLYLSRRSPDELARVRALVHQLACVQGLSRRQVRQRLFDHHVMRSVGSISQDLRDFECPACATTPAAPEPASAARPAARPEALSWQ